MTIEELKKEAERFSLHLSDDQIEKFESYLELLSKWNEVMDLTAIKETSKMIEKHFLDSLYLSSEVKFDDQKILDIGSGAGFPGLVLKIAYPNLDMTLLEPTQKRVKFLREVISILNLTKIEVVCMRAEDYIIDHREEFDIVTARAVARLNILLELGIPFLKVDGKLILLKGSKADIEVNESKNALKSLDSKIERILPYFLSDEILRNVISIAKEKETKKIYPRRFSVIKNKPL